MPGHDLEETLRSLHEELSRHPTVRPETRRLLTEVARDIERLASEESEEGAPQDFLARLRAATEQFEEEHPALTTAVERLSDALSKMGI